MTIYAIYYTANGEINQIYQGDDPSAFVGPDEDTIIVDDSVSDTTSYVLGGVITPRPLLTSINSWDTTSFTADGVTTITFGSSLPVGTAYTIKSPLGVASDSGTITDGSLSISTVVPGEYLLTLEIFPYQPYIERLFAVALDTIGLTIYSVSQQIIPIADYYYSGGILEVATYTQTGPALYQELEADPTIDNGTILEVLSITQTPLDISLENSYNLILNVAEYFQSTYELNTNITIIELEVANYTQDSPVPDSLETFIPLYVSEILQEPLDITTVQNFNQLLFVASYTQAGFDITL